MGPRAMGPEGQRPREASTAPGNRRMAKVQEASMIKTLLAAFALLSPSLVRAAAPERAGLVTMGGKPVVLQGTPVKVGDRAPDFTAVDADWKPVKLSDFRGKVVVLSAVP